MNEYQANPEVDFKAELHTARQPISKVSSFGKNFKLMSVLIIVTGWIFLCKSLNDVFLNQALSCAVIILSVLFFKAAEQDGNQIKS